MSDFFYHFRLIKAIYNNFEMKTFLIDYKVITEGVGNSHTATHSHNSSFNMFAIAAALLMSKY